MDKVVLKATKRTVTGKHVNALRRAGFLPAVIYGHKVDPVAISLEAHSSNLILARISPSTLVTIDVEGKEYATLVREKQRNFILGTLKHVDFLAVSLTESIRATVGITLHGTAPAVKEFNGVLVNGVTDVQVECLPGDLPTGIDFDLSTLTELGSGFHVRDIKLSDKVTILNNPDDLIVLVTGTKEETLEEGEGSETSEPEVIEKGKKDEDGE
jgi:large subunit ribosomal protein L25